MKIELWIIGITGFLVWNVYHEGKYMKMLLDHKKYFQMAGIGFAGLATILFLKKFPRDTQSMIVSASSLVKYLPMDKYTSKVVSPMLDITSRGFGKEVGVKSFQEEMTNMNPTQRQHLLQKGYQGGMPPYMGHVVQQGVAHQETQRRKRVPRTNAIMKRSVSEAKKKYVASQQAWRCGHCGGLLDATYEVDHKVALMHGGTNDVNNLEALCPNCHRKKTTKDRLGLGGI